MKQSHNSKTEGPLLGFPRWVVLSVAAALVLVVLAGGSLFAYNQFQQALSSSATSESSATPVKEQMQPPVVIDDSAAILNLLGTSGALNGVINGKSDFDCMFLGAVLPDLRNSTPLEAYRGKFEMILNYSNRVLELCLRNPEDPNAIEQAVMTRELISDITD